jgi:hypothetical protein
MPLSSHSRIDESLCEAIQSKIHRVHSYPASPREYDHSAFSTNSYDAQALSIFLQIRLTFITLFLMEQYFLIFVSHLFHFLITIFVCCFYDIPYASKSSVSAKFGKQNHESFESWILRVLPFCLSIPHY